MWKPRFQRRKASMKWTCGACFFVVLCLYNGFSKSDLQGNDHAPHLDDFTPNEQNGHLPVSRQLLFTLTNCTPPAIEQFPGTYFTPAQRTQGAVIIHILVSLYMFLGLAIACDEYFVPSLEILCDVLKVKPDVAGATFMAAGSSAPELATAVIGVFIAEDDIGLGSVVGSAVFNIMLVISVCALFAGAVVHLTWWPLFRDCAFYTISIASLVLVIYDEEVHWYEAGAMLILYAIYILVMYWNESLSEFMISKFTCCGSGKTEEETELVRYDKTLSTDSEEEESDEGCLTPPSGACQRIFWCISLPLTAIMCSTTPDCRKKKWRKWFFITFLMSCVWISLYSYVMIWMITIIGFTFHVPDTIMGLTFIAAGVSVPDAIASLLVVRDGYGDMAVSNAVGSNVFDILLCLGLPWFLKTTIVTPNAPVIVYSAGLIYSSLTLLSTVVFLLLATHLNGWKLDIKYGIVLLVTYFLFMILATLYELNIFGYVHPPECPSSL